MLPGKQLNLADQLGYLFTAWEMMGVSWDTGYDSKEAVNDGSFILSCEKIRRGPNPKARIWLNPELSVTQNTIHEPAWLSMQDLWWYWQVLSWKVFF